MVAVYIVEASAIIVMTIVVVIFTRSIGRAMRREKTNVEIWKTLISQALARRDTREAIRLRDLSSADIKAGRFAAEEATHE